jgi:NAD(P)-dependent dehydrogenase (short-subunit alcohol dehydrogenase family)
MTCVIFGATGSIGNYLFNNIKMNVIGTSTKHNEYLFVDNYNLDNLNNINNLDVVIWAHGVNFNDNIFNYDNNNFNNMMNCNVTFILKTLNYLLKNNKINNNARLIIISSIWEETARNNKLSYSITKSALSGMVKSLAYDLSSRHILINNVLPGVIDNNMTRNTLDKQQLTYIEKYTGFNRLISLDDILNTINFLIFSNTGITGQSIKVDLGFTTVRKYE